MSHNTTASQEPEIQSSVTATSLSSHIDEVESSSISQEIAHGNDESSQIIDISNLQLSSPKFG